MNTAVCCVRRLLRPLTSDLMPTEVFTQPGGTAFGVLRSKPTTPATHRVNRGITAVPIDPFNPVTRMVPGSVVIDVLQSAMARLGSDTPPRAPDAASTGDGRIPVTRWT